MSTKNKAYKFRLYPNKEQEVLIDKTIGCTRFIYNRMLSDKIEHYKETKETLKNTPSQYKEEFPWLKEIDSLALANAQMNLQTAYNNFFRRPEIGFPKFKSKKRSKLSYTTNSQSGSIRITNENHIRLPKLKDVKIKMHRDIPSTHIIKSATITKTPTNKYFISILVEYEHVVPIVNLDKNNALGLDYASHSFYVDNQNREAGYPKFYRSTQIKLAKEQRKLSLMKYGSNNYYKQKIIVAKLHEHIANQRKDWLHKLSVELANNYDYVCIEDVDMKKMSQSLSLGKSTHDNGFGVFRVILNYKLEDRGKKLIKIDKWFPSSKMCRFCGIINKDLTLADRIWTCSCGEVLNRDENAAINIMNVGLSMV